ncbi:MAG: hypothetical protein LBH37_02550 [Oscillospiraceae bacterium]|nr:hypothetical protein [Oscillospiraceae bacterium]
MFDKKDKFGQKELQNNKLDDDALENASGGKISAGSKTLEFWLDNRSGTGFEGEIDSVVKACKRNGLNFISVPVLKASLNSKINKLDSPSSRVNLQVKILSGGFFSIENCQIQGY